MHVVMTDAGHQRLAGKHSVDPPAGNSDSSGSNVLLDDGTGGRREHGESGAGNQAGAPEGDRWNEHCHGDSDYSCARSRHVLLQLWTERALRPRNLPKGFWGTCAEMPVASGCRPAAGHSEAPPPFAVAPYLRCPGREADWGRQAGGGGTGRRDSFIVEIDPASGLRDSRISPSRAGRQSTGRSPAAPGISAGRRFPAAAFTPSENVGWMQMQSVSGARVPVPAIAITPWASRSAPW